MALLYITAAKEAHAEQIIEKSRFIAHIKPVKDRSEAEAYIAQIRSQYKDATHNVPAFVIGDKQQLVWGSDDGEPGGTAGSPVAMFLQNEGLANVVCVVTRYFGGIKLGPGGLVRAYTSSARLALEKAGKAEVREFETLNIRLDYNLLGKLQNLEKSSDFTIKDIVYSDKAEVCLGFEPEYKMSMDKILSDLCSGKPEIIEG